MKEIKVCIRDIYGVAKAYPVCQDGEKFAYIAGTKTLTRRTLGCVLGLGYTLVEVSRHGHEIARYAGEAGSALVGRVD